MEEWRGTRKLEFQRPWLLLVDGNATSDAGENAQVGLKVSHVGWEGLSTSLMA